MIFIQTNFPIAIAYFFFLLLFFIIYSEGQFLFALDGCFFYRKTTPWEPLNYTTTKATTTKGQDRIENGGGSDGFNNRSNNSYADEAADYHQIEFKALNRSFKLELYRACVKPEERAGRSDKRIPWEIREVPAMCLDEWPNGYVGYDQYNANSTVFGHVNAEGVFFGDILLGDGTGYKIGNPIVFYPREMWKKIWREELDGGVHSVIYPC